MKMESATGTHRVRIFRSPERARATLILKCGGRRFISRYDKNPFACRNPGVIFNPACWREEVIPTDEVLRNAPVRWRQCARLGFSVEYTCVHCVPRDRQTPDTDPSFIRPINDINFSLSLSLFPLTAHTLDLSITLLFVLFVKERREKMTRARDN